MSIICWSIRIREEQSRQSVFDKWLPEILSPPHQTSLMLHLYQDLSLEADTIQLPQNLFRPPAPAYAAMHLFQFHRDLHVPVSSPCWHSPHGSHLTAGSTPFPRHDEAPVPSPDEEETYHLRYSHIPLTLPFLLNGLGYYQFSLLHSTVFHPPYLHPRNGQHLPGL